MHASGATSPGAHDVRAPARRRDSAVPQLEARSDSCSVGWDLGNGLVDSVLDRLTVRNGPVRLCDPFILIRSGWRGILDASLMAHGEVWRTRARY